MPRPGYFIEKRLSRSSRVLSTFLLLFVFLFGCASPKPIREYSIARAAIKAARRAQAPRFAPGYWSQAEENYMLGEQAYKESRFDAARELMVRTRILAEKAENQARFRRWYSGEGE